MWVVLMFLCGVVQVSAEGEIIVFHFVSNVRETVAGYVTRT